MSIEATNRRKAALAVLFAAVMTLSASAPALAHDGSKHEGGQAGAGSSPSESARAAEVDLLDLELLDRRGEPLRFRSEAVADRIVVVDFIYTTCTTICPILSALMAQVQDELGASLDEQVRLISISIEPTRDTPKRLDAYARKFDAGPGWIWLTGQKSAVDRVLLGLDSYTPEFVDHAPTILVGDARRNKWRRLFGFPTPEEILAQVREFVAARTQVQTTSKPEN